MPGHRDLPPELIHLILSHVSDHRDLFACTLVSRRWSACANPRLWRLVRTTSFRSLRMLEELVQQSAALMANQLAALRSSHDGPMEGHGELSPYYGQGGPGSGSGGGGGGGDSVTIGPQASSTHLSFWQRNRLKLRGMSLSPSRHRSAALAARSDVGGSAARSLSWSWSSGSSMSQTSAAARDGQHGDGGSLDLVRRNSGSSVATAGSIDLSEQEGGRSVSMDQPLRKTSSMTRRLSWISRPRRSLSRRSRSQSKGRPQPHPWISRNLVIEHLHISISTQSILHPDVSRTVARILSHLPNCYSLSLPSAHIRSIHTVFKSPQNLTHLDISQVVDTQRTDRLLGLVAAHCPDLLSIVFGPTICMGHVSRRDGLRTLGTKCRKLEQIVLHGERYRVHSHTTPLLALLRQCTNLRRVHLNYLCCTEYRQLVSCIANNNPSLEYLHIRLAVLSATWADHVLVVLARKCRSLRYLQVQPFPSFSDAGLHFLVSQCPITHLSIQDAFLVTSIGVSTIGRYGRHVAKLDISRCPSVGLRDVERMSAGVVNTSLRHLVLNDMFGDAGLRDVVRALQVVAERCTRLLEFEFTLPVSWDEVVDVWPAADPEILVCSPRPRAGVSRGSASDAQAHAHAHGETEAAWLHSSLPPASTSSSLQPFVWPPLSGTPPGPCQWCDRGAKTHIVLSGRHLRSFCNATFS